MAFILRNRFYAGRDEIEGRLMDIIDTAIKQSCEVAERACRSIRQTSDLDAMGNGSMMCALIYLKNVIQQKNTLSRNLSS